MLPTKYSGRQLELQLCNALIATHDLACGCQDPIKHAIQLLLKFGIDSSITPQTRNQLECLLSTATGSDHTTDSAGDAVDAVLADGDLEELFKETFEDDTG